MTKSGKAFAFALALLMLLCFCVNSFAYNIDGTVDGVDEWKGIQVIDVSGKDETGSNIKNVILRYDLQANPAVLYVAIQCIEGKGEIESIDQCGIEIVLNGSDIINITPDSAEYDENLFYINSAFSQQFDGMSVEMKIGFKEAVTGEVDFRFNVTDSDGNRSRQFNLTMKEDTDDEPVEQQTSSTTKKSGKSSKTTKKSSAGSKTSKKTADVYSTVNPKDYTTTDKASDAKGSTSVFQTVNTAETQTSQHSDESNETGKTVLKTVSVGIITVALAAFVTTFLKKKKI